MTTTNCIYSYHIFCKSSSSNWKKGHSIINRTLFLTFFGCSYPTSIPVPAHRTMHLIKTCTMCMHGITKWWWCWQKYTLAQLNGMRWGGTNINITLCYFPFSLFLRKHCANENVFMCIFSHIHTFNQYNHQIYSHNTAHIWTAENKN